MSYRTLATVVTVDEDRHPLILPDGCASGGEVVALRASGYNPQPGDRCMVTKVGMRFIAEYAVDGALSAGLSAYEIAVANGFSGTETAWLASLVGADGADGAAGASAYQLAVAGGFTGSQAQWLESLVGPEGPAGMMPTTPDAFVPIVVEFLNPLGVSPLSGTAINGGTSYGVDGDADHPGVCVLNSSLNAQSGYYYHTAIETQPVAGGEAVAIIFKLGTTLNTTCRFGLHDSTGYSQPLDGVWLDIAGTMLSGKARSNATESVTGTTYTLASGVWYRGAFVVDAEAETVALSLYDCATGTLLWSGVLDANIPSGAGRNVGVNALAISSGTTSVALCYLDWLKFTVDRALTR